MDHRYLTKRERIGYMIFDKKWIWKGKCVLHFKWTVINKVAFYKHPQHYFTRLSIITYCTFSRQVRDEWRQISKNFESQDLRFREYKLEVVCADVVTDFPIRRLLCSLLPSLRRHSTHLDLDSTEAKYLLRTQEREIDIDPLQPFVLDLLQNELKG